MINMQIEPASVWRKTKVIREESTVDQAEMPDDEPDPHTNKNFSNALVMSEGYIPISFSMLNDFGLTLLSERRSGEEEWESRYSVVHQGIKLSLVDKQVYLKRVLQDKPSFLKLYYKRLDNNSNRVIIVNDRKKRIVFQKNFNFTVS
jgi:hypothetical protein